MFLYYDDLSIRNDVRVNEIHAVRVLTGNALTALRNILGIGLGVGLAKARPTKQKSLAYCSVGDIITSIEAPAEIPGELLSKPMSRSQENGVDFFYNYPSHKRSCEKRI